MSQQKSTRKKESAMKGVAKEILLTSLYLLAALTLTYLVIHFVGQRTEVIGSSMYPTLEDTDNLIVSKITYRIQDPKRFDIIVFPFQYENETYFIKRIIGLPGETVRIDEQGVIYINDVELKENYGREVIEDPGRALQPITLGDDEYFVLGDNRNNSTDSRTAIVGNVKRSQIIGKAWIRIYPFSKFGKIDH